MTRGRVLVVDQFHEVLVELLEENGFECDVQPGLPYEEILKIIKSYKGLIVRSKTIVDKKLLDFGEDLSFVGRAGSGMENIDKAYAVKNGIQCYNSPEGNKDAVGEQAIGMMLCLLHNIVKSDREIRNKLWQRKPNTGMELSYKTIGVIGYGNTGKALCEKLSGFGASILVYDKYLSGFEGDKVQEVSMEEIYEKADIISIHLQLTPETKHLVDSQFIDRFKKKILLINTSRGPIVNTLDLLEKIEEGKVLGAALDVYENENWATFTEKEWDWMDQLIERNNVVLTPHVAGWSVESEYKIAQVLAQKIIQDMTNVSNVS